MMMTEISKEQEEQQTPVKEAQVDPALLCQAVGIDLANEGPRMTVEAEVTSQSFQKRKAVE